ncbi:MAG: hypothetical protein HRU75_11935 [Planctomycetia bacterium]|nr:MAG: hypothetical protein HRU75_11935 [Planctomycetia bacterium]
MHSRRRMTWSVLFTFSALLASGCAGGSTVSDTRAGSPVQHPVLQNVPLPGGFELVDDRSRISSNGQIRFAQCEFSGRAERTSVYEFFKNYMPTGGWSLQDERLIGGVYELRYGSPTERCDVRISRSGRGTRIDIEVRPSADSGEAAPPPPKWPGN